MTLRLSRPAAAGALALVLFVAGPHRPLPAGAQERGNAPWADAYAGSEVERYLRTLQTIGRAGENPWMVRGFSRVELELIAPADGTRHPWEDRFDLTRESAARGGVLFAFPEVAAVANSTFAYGDNDGAVWAGRGLTVALRGGGQLRTGPLTLSLRPVAFWAQNASFPEAPPLAPIDAPDRLGDEPYGRIDAGESSVRFDWNAVSVGLSTEGMIWGPSERYPLVLGTNGPGFLHLFLGTGHPLDLGVGRLGMRGVWGRLEESGWLPPFEFSGPRFASSAVAVFEPLWPRGLSLGGSRLFHLPWRPGGPAISDVLRPIEAITRGGAEGDSAPSIPENQIASIFFRWAFAPSGLELYGELYREDHAQDLRDLAVEPDHDLATALGIRKAWSDADRNTISVLEIEVLDAKVTHLEGVRGQSLPYHHAPLLQGHTHRGQILGSPAAFGGEGLSFVAERYDPRGRRSMRLERVVRKDAREYYSVPGATSFRDVAYSLTAEVLTFRGRWDLVAEATGTWNLNRNLGGDRWNLRVALGGTWRPAGR